MAEREHEFSLTVNGAKTMDMIIVARREDNILFPSSPRITEQNISSLRLFFSEYRFNLICP